MRVARLYALVVTAMVLIAGGHRLFFVEAGAPTHWPSGMRFTTSCVTSTTSLTQTFHVTADAVVGITMRPVITPGTTGEAIFELRDGATPGGAVRHRAAMSIAQLANSSWTVRMPPIAAPADGRFTVWIGRSEDAGCLAFQASAVQAPDAHLAVGGRELFGDLLFQVHADRATALDGFQRWLARTTRIDLPSTVITLMALVYALSIGALCGMLTAGRRQPRPGGTRADVTGTLARVAE